MAHPDLRQGGGGDLASPASSSLLCDFFLPKIEGEGEGQEGPPPLDPPLLYINIFWLGLPRLKHFIKGKLK